MKLIVTVSLITAITAGLISCKKEYSDAIAGRWNIVTDSSFVGQSPPFFNPGAGHVYKGITSDYYDFRTDGRLYIKEGAYSDTLTYQVRPDKHITFVYNTYLTTVDSLGNIISQVHPKKNYTITTLSANNLTMTSDLTSDILTPVGYFANKLMLAK